MKRVDPKGMMQCPLQGRSHASGDSARPSLRTSGVNCTNKTIATKERNKKLMKRCGKTESKNRKLHTAYEN